MSQMLAELSWTARMSLAIVYLFSGVAKLWDGASLVAAVRSYRIVPDQIAGRVAWLLPTTELAVAAMLLTGVGTEIAVWVAVLMAGMFAAAVVINLRRGRIIPCHCFGPASDRIGRATLVRIGAVGFLAVFLLMTLNRVESGSQSWRPPTQDWLTSLSTVGAVAGFILLLGSMSNLWGQVIIVKSARVPPPDTRQGSGHAN